MSIQNLILKYAPIIIQNIGISLYNTYLYRQRHTGQYKNHLDFYRNLDITNTDLIHSEKNKRLENFLKFCTSNSPWYSHLKGKKLSEFPILEKQELIQNIDKICTIEEKEGIISYTGGTTGASMKVVYTYDDMQERFAIKNHFRETFGYSLGKKVAWFSGKSLVRPRDLKSGHVYRDDYINKIRFFSTFHINEENFDAYWSAFLRFKPEFIVGFPSSLYELCYMAKARNLKYSGNIKTFFPTAETVIPKYRHLIKEILGCEVVDQYASSEGAPFILQCSHGSLHIHPLSGVFEVVDENMEPTDEGEILVTSFTTHGTPLIRYRIGDRVKLAPKIFQCGCGSCFPVVEYIDGRTSDFIFSIENGKVNLGNISNCTKGIEGIIAFQATQKETDSVDFSIVSDHKFTAQQQNKFAEALKLRLGNKTRINLHKVDYLPKEKSGKFKIIKNYLTPEQIEKTNTLK